MHINFNFYFSILFEWALAWLERNREYIFGKFSVVIEFFIDNFFYVVCAVCRSSTGISDIFYKWMEEKSTRWGRVIWGEIHFNFARISRSFRRWFGIQTRSDFSSSALLYSSLCVMALNEATFKLSTRALVLFAIMSTIALQSTILFTIAIVEILFWKWIIVFRTVLTHMRAKRWFWMEIGIETHRQTSAERRVSVSPANWI